jgi:lysophospholipase L1-like esterase
MKRPEIVSPGNFGVTIAADSRRIEFDLKNESILHRGVPVDFLFLGDSITHYWELEAYFHSDQGLILNRGIAGDSSEFALRRFLADVVQLKPKMAVLMIGVNDTKFRSVFPSHSSPLNPDPDKIVHTITANIKQMVNLADDHDLPIAVCSILPLHLPLSSRSGECNRIITKVNHSLKTFAHTRGVPFVDYHSRFVGDDGMTLREHLSDDGIHPHSGGYEIMAQVLSETLQGQIHLRE